jgi:hypothetical protein
MARRRCVWLVAVPLAAAGWLAAHALAYILVAPEHHDHHRLLSETGHGYLDLAPLLMACMITLMVAGVALAVHDGHRGRARSRMRAWPVALLLPGGFAVVEHLERLIERNAFPLDAALEPTFQVGVTLQLLVAGMVILVARGILVLGHTLGQRLVVWRIPLVPARQVQTPRPRPLEPDLARLAILATGHGERAPPSRARI